MYVCVCVCVCMHVCVCVCMCVYACVCVCVCVCRCRFRCRYMQVKVYVRCVGVHAYRQQRPINHATADHIFNDRALLLQQRLAEQRVGFRYPLLHAKVKHPPQRDDEGKTDRQDRITCAPTGTHTHIYTHIHIYMHTHNTHTHTHTYTHKHTHTHTHTHAYTPKQHSPTKK